MFPLGHVGIGTALVPPSVRARLRWGWLAFGCLLPDLIDKPLFFGMIWLFGRQPAHEAVLRGSRLFGHTLLFLAALALWAGLARSRAVAAVAVGTLTHLALDLAAEVVAAPSPEASIWRALLWPATGLGFPQARGTSWTEHLRTDAENVVYAAGEVLGAALLLARAIGAHRRRRAAAQRS